MIAVFVLLTVLLSVINGINFTMVAADADRVTETIAGGKGSFEKDGAVIPREFPRGNENRSSPLGPDSPEMPYSARYFTYRINSDGMVEKVAFNITAISESEAELIAIKLGGEHNSTGWTRRFYRYRIYKNADYTYVTVVDQGRELLPSYRILIISVVGEFICLAVCLAFLIIMSKKIFRPIEEADRKQKEFLSEAESEFKIPLTVINANTEVIEKSIGSNEQTQSINRQVKKMISLTKKLSSFVILEDEEGGDVCDLSLVLATVTESASGKFAERGIDLTRSIENGVFIPGDAEVIRKAVKEIVENSLKFSNNRAEFRLYKEGDRIILTSSNDSNLPDGTADQVFDRFTRLENAAGKEGNGLGLSYVKDVVKSLNGRLSARVENGVFSLRITL